MNKKIRNFALLGVAILSMFACKPDRHFEAAYTSIYVIQEDRVVDGDTVPYYAPYFVMQSNEMLNTYRVYSVQKDANAEITDTLNYPIIWQSATNTGVFTYYANIKHSKYPWLSAEEAALNMIGPYNMEVYNIAGEKFTNQISINGLDIDTLGAVKINHAQYIPGQYLSIKVYPVENAVMYALAISPEDHPQYREIFSASNYENSNLIQVRTNDLNRFDDGQKFIIRVIASNAERLVRESKPIVIEMGKEELEYTAE
ncbi:MAG: hypothetical protein J6K74_01635 [Marinifilaceae bacterium]|nr:hypothetical protein [Marinifilaceae bacterium]